MWLAAAGLDLGIPSGLRRVYGGNDLIRVNREAGLLRIQVGLLRCGFLAQLRL